MFTEQAFADAQKHGYRIVNRIVGAETSPTRTQPTIHIDQDYFYTLGDPAFWRALGEAKGWTDPDQFPKWKKEEGTTLIIFYPDNSWAAWQHRYLDHIIENGYNDHQQFFKQFCQKDEESV